VALQPLLAVKVMLPGVTRVVDFVDSFTNTTLVAAQTFEATFSRDYLITPPQLHKLAIYHRREHMIGKDMEGRDCGLF
jgi:hypothetical protein